MLSLVSCCSDDNVERRLTNTQKETYGQNISGEYPGEYIIIYKDKDCTDMTDEKGRHIITKAHEATFGEVQLDVSDNKMQHIFFQDFPVSLISKVVDADEYLYVLNNFIPVFANNQIYSQGYFNELSAFVEAVEGNNVNIVTSLESVRDAYLLIEKIKSHSNRFH